MSRTAPLYQTAWESALLADPAYMAKTRARLMARWHEEPDGCWAWTGTTLNSGYGTIYVLGRSRLAHRVAYVLSAAQPIGELQIDHLCRRKPCVNPSHLEVVTPAVNSQRGATGRHSFQADLTHCPRGHPYEGTNLRLYRGSRSCRACAAISVAEYRKRNARLVCAVDGCAHPVRDRGLCTGHYLRLRKHGDLFVEYPIGQLPRKQRAPCIVADCDKPAKAHELCPTHYAAWRRAKWRV